MAQSYIGLVSSADDRNGDVTLKAFDSMVKRTSPFS